MKNITFILLLSVMGFTACSYSENETDAWGNFETRETIISAQVSGKLLQFDTEQGKTLEKGVRVGMVDTTRYALNHQLLLAQRQSVATKIQDIDANIAVMQTQKQNLEREINRTRKLLQDQAATPLQLDDLEGKHKVTEQQIQAAKQSKNSIHAELQAMEAQIALSEDQLDKCIISNPLQGIVLEKYAEPYELVMPGKALYKIADLSIMDLKVYISGSQLPHIQLGQKVQVFIDDDARTNRMLEGTINWISTRAEFTPKTIQTKEERVSQVYSVKISVLNDGSIKIGMPGEVKF